MAVSFNPNESGGGEGAGNGGGTPPRALSHQPPRRRLHQRCTPYSFASLTLCRRPRQRPWADRVAARRPWACVCVPPVATPVTVRSWVGGSGVVWCPTAPPGRPPPAHLIHRECPIIGP